MNKPELFYTIEFEDALDTTICIHCSSQLPFVKHRANATCDRCHASLQQPHLTAEAFLRKKISLIYKFAVHTTRANLANSFEIMRDPHIVGGTVFEFKRGNPYGRAAKLPTVRSLRVGVAERRLGNEERKLMDEVLLSYQQCHMYMVSMYLLLKKELLESEHVFSIQEVTMAPKHVACGTHLLWRVTLCTGEMFAVAFADRQLGWLGLVVPWDEYKIMRIDTEELVKYQQFGTKMESDLADGADRSRRPGENDKVFWERLEREKNVQLGLGILGEWNEWRRRWREKRKRRGKRRQGVV
ncbi:hypothetical protein BDV95DRAFT_614521 [Massariosphaeria phaeospora]|uniref:Uncharacterized protein n=1 Tax=Massariosphaeria phaeospora TaxID=100035 RepID=A0A7C8MH02_9PLEO|nr:hypothetical protein BDV95DRAFT_614521 [Massariosphaeria phaeospora]